MGIRRSSSATSTSSAPGRSQVRARRGDPKFVTRLLAAAPIIYGDGSRPDFPVADGAGEHQKMAATPGAQYRRRRRSVGTVRVHPDGATGTVRPVYEAPRRRHPGLLTSPGPRVRPTPHPVRGAPAGGGLFREGEDAPGQPGDSGFEWSSEILNRVPPLPGLEPDSSPARYPARRTGRPSVAGRSIP